MKNLKGTYATVRVVLVVLCLQMFALGQEEKKLATVTGGATLKFDIAVANSGFTITVSAPDEQVFRKDYKPGSSAEVKLVDLKGERLPDGQYFYELRITPSLTSDVKESLAAARVKGDEDVYRQLVKRGSIPAKPLVQSAGFSITNGSAVVAGAADEGTSDRIGRVMPQSQPRVFKPTSGAGIIGLQRHHAVVNPFFDFVIADDLIVQGSACVGLDCVDGEVFGFDTIRVKENNTRIQFDDTSTSAGFATNNWQIRANSSASGGGNFLAFVDQGGTGNSESGTIVFEVDAGAPANSLRVSSGGNVGIGTATPVLDVHANTTDTPAIRLEQNNSGGFTAQTWDIGANEANFFVRDVTSGSRLPFRIRPGAPTSSIDISATGNIGIGTGSPARSVSIHATQNPILQLTNNTAGTTANDGLQVVQDGLNAFVENQEAGNMTLRTSATDRITILSGGNVGIGTAAPTDLLSVNGNASKPGGGTWGVFSDERLKNIKGPFSSGLKAVMQLQPLRYEYKPQNALGIKLGGEHIGFGARAVQRVIPEAVTQTANGYLVVNNDPIIWTMLNAIKEQQAEIEKLRTEVRRLRATSRRRR
jgi:Chaperone of endosialidase